MLRTTDPDGHRWTLRRRWLNLELPRWRGPRELPDGGGGSIADDPFGIFAVIAAIVLVIVLLVFAVPAVIFGGELVIVLAVASAGLVGRLAFGRPWTVEARSDHGAVIEREVVGYRNAGEALQDLRAEVEAGRPAASATASAPSPARRGWQAATAIVLALLWLGGATSVVALLMATAVRRAPETGTKARVAAWVAVAAAVAGLVLTALVILGAISKHQRVG